MKKTTPKPTQPVKPTLPPLPVEEPVMDEAAAVAAALSAPRRVANKPDISRLPDGVVDGVPLFRRGDRIVIERYSRFLPGAPYVDTRTWLVQSVDPDTGHMALYDEALQQHGTGNWRVGMRFGDVVKLAMGNAVATKKKRGRPRKNPVAPVEAAPSAEGTEKKRRGRPKGSKNRPREEVRAEKAAKVAARAARVATEAKGKRRAK